MSEKTKKILVIDDEEEIVNAAKRMLERSGYTVDTAFNGAQGMEHITQSRPDVVITDIIMPIMDGYEFFKQLRNEAETSKIPVIILTARPNMEDSFRALGVDGFITKPFTSENLVDKIEQITDPETELAHRGKTLVIGSDEYTINHMSILLKDDGYQTAIAEDTPELIYKALTEIPDYIFVDVFRRDIPTREIVKSLRAFHKLDNTKIILYANFNPQKPGIFDNVDHLGESKQECMREGADYYIGRFSSANFIEGLNNFRLG